MKRVIISLFFSVSLFAEKIDANVLQVDMSLDDDVTCLALNMYHEARSESTAGMWAVSDVVINRVKSSVFPNSICEVIKQGPIRESWKTFNKPFLTEDQRIYYPVRGQCQFSWYCDGRSDVPTELFSWQRALELARLMLEYDKGIGITDGADHYHADYINPKWNQSMLLTARIDNHVFYKDIR